MAKQYDDELKGVLFKNDNKQRDNQPDYNGSCTILGVEYWIAGWINESREGKKYISFAFTDKRESKGKGKGTGGGKGGGGRRHEEEAPPEDDIPF